MSDTKFPPRVWVEEPDDGDSQIRFNAWKTPEDESGLQYKEYLSAAESAELVRQAREEGRRKGLLDAAAFAAAHSDPIFIADKRAECWIPHRHNVTLIPKFESRRIAVSQCPLKDGVRLLEIREGELPISKADLAREWDKRVAGATVRTAECGPHFEWFCKALGFDAGKGE